MEDYFYMMNKMCDFISAPYFLTKLDELFHLYGPPHLHFKNKDRNNFFEDLQSSNFLVSLHLLCV